MSLSRLYIYRPPASRVDYAYLNGVLAEVQKKMNGDAQWDGCDLQIVELTDQLGFDLVNEVRRIKSAPGPVIFASKVQHRLYKQLSEKLARDVKVYRAQGATCGHEMFVQCQEARSEYLGGEPKIYRRELICYLIITKLSRRGHWAGEAKNKSFLRADDIPKGGFPSDVSKREVLDAADVLANAGVLKRKRGDGRQKYGLANKSIAQPIIETMSLSGHASVEKWICKDARRVSAKDLTRNYDQSC